MGKGTLRKCDICTKFITPGLRHTRLDEMSQSRDEVNFTIRHKCGADV